jgi:signal transduction histidine kinase
MQLVTDRPRELMIRSRHETPQVLVGVTEGGIGISAENADFKPFLTTKSSGMGMGLSICRSIIEAHGGRAVGHGEPTPRRHGSIHPTAERFS